MMDATCSSQEACIVDREVVYDGWYRLERLRILMPDGAAVERHLLDNGSAVAALLYDRERRTVILITQPRAGPLAGQEPPLLEAVAGNLDAASAQERIREEAMEEAGVRIGELIPVANIWSLPPVSTERIALFLAPYTAEDVLGEGGGAAGEHENITVCEISCVTLANLVHQGRLTDAKTLILAQALMLREPGLFHD